MYLSNSAHPRKLLAMGPCLEISCSAQLAVTRTDSFSHKRPRLEQLVTYSPDNNNQAMAGMPFRDLPFWRRKESALPVTARSEPWGLAMLTVGCMIIKDPPVANPRNLARLFHWYFFLLRGRHYTRQRHCCSWAPRSCMSCQAQCYGLTVAKDGRSDAKAISGVDTSSNFLEEWTCTDLHCQILGRIGTTFTANHLIRHPLSGVTKPFFCPPVGDFPQGLEAPDCPPDRSFLQMAEMPARHTDHMTLIKLWPCPVGVKSVGQSSALL